jgi:opacity protein-like surface antigen
MMKTHRHTRIGIWSALAGTLLLVVSGAGQPARAYSLSGAGGKLGYSNPSDFDGTAIAGVHAEFEQSGTRLHLLPNMMYWNVDHVRDVSPNFDLTYHFDRSDRMTPYVGGGLGLHFVDDSRGDRSGTDVGLNLVGGLSFPTATNHYFLEGRYTASDIPQFALMGGVTFHTR